MWEIFEHRRTWKQLDRLPRDVLERYEKWKDIVRLSGPLGLRSILGFNDGALRGDWKGHRSSRLNRQYRVIYRIERDKVLVEVVSITAHVTGRSNMSEYRKAKKRIDVSIGESVRILRELQELSQNELSEMTGIPQSTISAIERDRIRLGVERAKVFARALRCHPAILVFPGWDVEHESAA